MNKDKAIIINVDYLLEGYVLIPKEQWEELLKFLKENGADLTHTMDNMVMQ